MACMGAGLVQMIEALSVATDAKGQDWVQVSSRRRDCHFTAPPLPL